VTIQALGHGWDSKPQWHTCDAQVEEKLVGLLLEKPDMVQLVVVGDGDSAAGGAGGDSEVEDGRRMETTSDAGGNEQHLEVGDDREDDNRTSGCDRKVHGSSTCHTVRSLEAKVGGMESGDDGEAEETILDYPDRTEAVHLPKSWESSGETLHDEAVGHEDPASEVPEETCRNWEEDSVPDPPKVLLFFLDEQSCQLLPPKQEDSIAPVDVLS
jgi:hypothetical protein